MVKVGRISIYFYKKLGETRREKRKKKGWSKDRWKFNLFKGGKMLQALKDPPISEEEKENTLNYEVAANLDDFGVCEKQIGKKNVTLNLTEVTV